MKHVWLLFLLLSMPGLVAGDNTEERVRQALVALRGELSFPGASVAWVGGNAEVHTLAIGVADPATGRALSPESRMLAASIGKSFAAAAILSLAEEEKLDLDAPVSRWLAGRSWFARLPNHAELTLRHLLTHSGGGFAGTARDLARWGRLLWSGRLHSESAFREMLAGVPVSANRPGVTYGLGVVIEQSECHGEIRRHGGWIPGYVSSLRYFPESDTAIAIQINSDVGMMGEEGRFLDIEAAVTRAIFDASKPCH